MAGGLLSSVPYATRTPRCTPSRRSNLRDRKPHSPQQYSPARPTRRRSRPGLGTGIMTTLSTYGHLWPSLGVQGREDRPRAPRGPGACGLHVACGGPAGRRSQRRSSEKPALSCGDAACPNEGRTTWATARSGDLAERLTVQATFSSPSPSDQRPRPTDCWAVRLP